MRNQVLEELKELVVKRLAEVYGRCSVADGCSKSVISCTDRAGRIIEISITSETNKDKKLCNK